MPVSLLPPPKIALFDNNGNPLSGGKVYTYEPGTTTPKATYTDYNGTTPNANPVILDTRGEASIWLSGQYKIIVKDSLDNLIYSQDYVSSQPYTSIAQSEWVTNSLVYTYLSATQFSVTGDETATFPIGRRVKCTVSAGTVYGVVTGSSYGSGVTTVTVSLDSGSLDSGLSAAAVGLLTPTHPSTHEGVYAGTAGTLAKNLTPISQIQAGGLVYAADTGGVNSIVAALAPAITAVSLGTTVRVKVANTNTSGTVTMNVNGTGGINVARPGVTSVLVGDLIAGYIYAFTLVNIGGTNYWMVNNPALVGTAQIVTGAVGSSQLAAGAAVANIGASGITSNEIAAANVTLAKLSVATGTYSTIANGTVYIAISAYSHSVGVRTGTNLGQTGEVISFGYGINTSNNYIYYAGFTTTGASSGNDVGYAWTYHS